MLMCLKQQLLCCLTVNLLGISWHYLALGSVFAEWHERFALKKFTFLREYVEMSSASCLNCSLHHYACRNDLRGPRVAGCEVRSLAAIDAQAENMAHIPIQWFRNDVNHGFSHV